MGVRENKVEKHLDSEVTSLGGLTRKWVSPGRDGVPDRIVILRCRILFVEVKTADGVLSPQQIREHKRLRDCGATVVTVYGRQGVDEMITDIYSKNIEEAYGR